MSAAVENMFVVARKLSEAMDSIIADHDAIVTSDFATALAMAWRQRFGVGDDLYHAMRIVDGTKEP